MPTRIGNCGLKGALKTGRDIAPATYDAGYGSSSRLYEKSSRFLGMTPGAYKRHGRGQRIYYSVAKCPLGLLLLAATRRGVCAVHMGDSKEDLVNELKNEFRECGHFGIGPGRVRVVPNAD